MELEKSMLLFQQLVQKEKKRTPLLIEIHERVVNNE